MQNNFIENKRTPFPFQGYLRQETEKKKKNELTKFWCHFCSVQFYSTRQHFHYTAQSIQCLQCGKDFCQQILPSYECEEYDPKKFRPPKITVPKLVYDQNKIQDQMKEEEQLSQNSSDNQQTSSTQNNAWQQGASNNDNDSNGSRVFYQPFISLEEEDEISYIRRRTQTNFRNLSRAIDLFIDTLSDYAILYGDSSPGILIRNNERVLTLFSRRMTPEQSIMNRSLHGLLNEVIGYHGATPSNILGINFENLWQNSELEGNDDQNYLDQILQFLIENDQNNFGSPPASRVAIQTLVLESSIPNKQAAQGLKECSICQQNYQLRDNFMEMPCGHYFHSNCLNPWLKERNSCPTCRFQLPTDDQQYEARKIAQHQQQQQQQQS